MIFYRLLTITLLPLVFLLFLYRCIIKKEIFSRIQEKFGFATIERPQGDLIWVHAVSVGEARAAMILVESYFNKFPDLNILITSSTITSAQIIDEEINKNFLGRVFHQFFPVDNPFSINLFLKNWRPQMVIFLESEIWPNFLSILSEKSIAILLANARISERTAKRWLFAKKFGIKPLDNFNKIFVQDLQDIVTFNKICDVDVVYHGNLKNEAKPLQFDQSELSHLKTQIGDRKIFLAASTHKGEESQIIKIHHNLKRNHRDLLTIIVIRHPDRSSEVKSLLKNSSYKVFDDGLELNDKDEILLVDKLGILGLFYRLCDFAFIAGSLQKIGGHNPCEPIMLDCAVISGVNYFNFKQTYSQLKKSQGCIIVEDEAELEAVIDSILSSDSRNDISNILLNGKNFIANSSRASERITAFYQGLF